MKAAPADPYPPISDYAFLSDCHSCALVSRDGSIDWCCFHRFDARPVFGRILDWSKGGFFRIAPAEGYTATRRYLPGTNLLETRFSAPHGVLTLLDCLPVAGMPDPSDAAAVHPFHQILRVVRCEEGEVLLSVEFFPRFDYGLTTPLVDLVSENVATVFGGADALVLQASLGLEAAGVGGCRGTVVLRAGERASFCLSYYPPHRLRVQTLDEAEIDRRIDATTRYWSEWSARCIYEGPYRDQVVRSALVLKGLINAPTGAIAAAATTSLPEEVGGQRNWDYRYAWLRDAALNLSALFTLGYQEEAHAFMDWVRRTTAGRASDLQVLYGVGGERFIPEIELPTLDGYRGSRPVRVGNAAVDQFQLDIYGEVLDTAWLYHRHGGDIDPAFWQFLTRVVEVVEARWDQPDEGLWEVRGGPRHFVSSKIMAWVALDRAIKLAEARGLPGDLARWRDLKKSIRTRIESEGVDPATGGLVQSFGSTAVDASALLAPLVHFFNPKDARVVATREAIEKILSRDGLVLRYASPDGLPGGEGAFVICSFWLVGNLALGGDITRARELFEKLLEYGGDLSLFAEQVDPASGAQLGNFPQAFSHAGLIGAAMNLMKAGGRAGA